MTVAHLFERTDARIEQFDDGRGASTPRGASSDQSDGERQGHERPDRRGKRIRRLDDLGPDAAEIPDEPGLLELIDHRA